MSGGVPPPERHRGGADAGRSLPRCGASRALVIAPRKSGTHLIRRAIAGFGYSAIGQVTLHDGDAPVSQETACRLLRLVYSGQELSDLAASADTTEARRAVARAVAAMVQAWEVRFGLLPRPEAERYGVHAHLVDRLLRNPDAAHFSSTPEGVCWFLHAFDVRQVDAGFLRDWTASGEPRIVFLYRDPRDTLLSMVDFLTGSPRHQLGAFGDHHVYAEVLSSLPDREAQITLALTDPAFPGADAYERHLWLLRHPRVCKVSYEDLVGPAGGGSAPRQLGAVRNMMAALDVDVEAEIVADQLFDPLSATFHRGRIGRWREQFTPRHVALHRERFRAVTEAYGYPP